jgi:hypothetical protein
MKIRVQPRNGDSFRRTVERALITLGEAEIISAQAGDSDGTLLVDPEEMPEALAALEKSGVRAASTDMHRGIPCQSIICG